MDEKLLEQCKVGLNISSDAFDPTLKQKILAMQMFMKKAGVSDENLASDLGIGTLVMGVSDLWELKAGESKVFPCFFNVSQSANGVIGMRFDSEIFLVSNKNSRNKLGDTIKKNTKRQVFAEKKSVRQSEFYQAAATGLKPEIAFDIWSREYNQEQFLEYEGIQYKIIRAFKKGEITELIAEGAVNHANA